MRGSRILLVISGLAVVATLVWSQQAGQKWRTSPTGYSDTPVIPGQKWKVHDIDRPKPPVVTPGTPSTQERIGSAPSDAIVLFDGKDLSKWREEGKGYNGEARWEVKDGSFAAKTGLGTLLTKEKFGDMQLHVEWAAPAVVDGDSQWRGNSGILLMNRYEVQVLDSYNNPSYADGQAAAIYGWWPPMVNASRKPGEWQMYDIVFEAPRFEGEKLLKPGYVTVFHNGVLVHNKQEIGGPMAHKIVRQYEPHALEQPLGLQNHDTATRYRYIWVRPLRGYDRKS